MWFYPDNGISFGNKKRGNSNPFYSMDEPWTHYAKWYLYLPATLCQGHLGPGHHPELPQLWNLKFHIPASDNNLLFVLLSLSDSCYLETTPSSIFSHLSGSSGLLLPHLSLESLSLSPSACPPHRLCITPALQGCESASLAWPLLQYFDSDAPWALFKINFYFDIISNLQKSYKNSTKSSHVLFTKIHQFLVFCCVCFINLFSLSLFGFFICKFFLNHFRASCISCLFIP